MGKIRVYELAKELEMESKDVIRRLSKLGSDVKNHMSTVEDEHAQMLREFMIPKLQLKHQKDGEPDNGDKSGAQLKAHKEDKAAQKAEKKADKKDEKNADREASAKQKKKEDKKEAKAGKKQDKAESKDEKKSAPKDMDLKGEKADKAEKSDKPGKSEKSEKADKAENKAEEASAAAENKSAEKQAPKDKSASAPEAEKDSSASAKAETSRRPEGETTQEAPKDSTPRKTGIFAKPDPNQPRKAGVFAKPDPNQPRKAGVFAKKDKPRNNDRKQNGKDGEHRFDNRRNNKDNNNNYNNGDRKHQNNNSNNNNNNNDRRPFNKDGHKDGDHHFDSHSDRTGNGRKPAQGNKERGGFADAPAEKKDSRRFDQKKKNNNNNYGARKKDMERTRNFEGNMNHRGPKPVKKKKAAQEVIAPVLPKTVVIGETVIVSELAKAMSKTAAELIKALMGLGFMATVNQEIDAETATILGEEFGITVELKVDDKMEILVDEEDDEATLVSRPPIITVMGHVDHGKTSLLDAIRNTHVIAGEAGGITQHIGAYQVEIDDRKITFLDTPGHEAFTEMRARGAQVTDIAILVVAADDGVMPQTVEAINHAKAAGVPIVVAINKIDKAGASPDKIRQELTEYELVDEEWGGNTIMVPISAKQGLGIDNLLEMILLVADMQELKANPDRNARGTVIESKLDKGRGPVATVLVQKGTLHVGDILVCGSEYAKVRAMVDDKGRRTKLATPSTPVEVLGFSDVPPAGEIFVCVADEKDAHYIAERNALEKRESSMEKTSMVSLDDLFRQISEEDMKELNIVLKADVHGSVEALSQSILNLSTDEVKVNIIHKGVGAIVETDVKLAEASNALIIGFNVRPDANTKKAAEKVGVEILMYRVIYEAIDSIKAAMSGLLDPEFKEEIVGHVEVRDVIKVPKVGSVAGCYVVDGKVIRGGKARVLRNGIVIHEGNIASLRRFKDDVKEVQTGFECGICVEDYNDIKVEDQIEIFNMVETKRSL